MVAADFRLCACPPQQPPIPIPRHHPIRLLQIPPYTPNKTPRFPLPPVSGNHDVGSVRKQPLPRQSRLQADVPPNMYAPRVAQRGRQVEQQGKEFGKSSVIRASLRTPCSRSKATPLCRVRAYSPSRLLLISTPSIRSRPIARMSAKEGLPRAPPRKKRRCDALPSKVRQQESQQRDGDHAVGNAEWTSCSRPEYCQRGTRWANRAISENTSTISKLTGTAAIFEIDSCF